MMRNKTYVLGLVLLIGSFSLEAQSPMVTNDDANVITTAVPFLQVATDARFSGMGNTAIAMDADANMLNYNAANLAFAKSDMQVGLSYNSWLKGLGINNVFLANISGYKQLPDNQTIGMGLSFFSLGSITYKDANHQVLTTAKPHELAFTLAYVRKLGKLFSIGLSPKYIYSNLGSGLSLKGQDVKAAHAFAADLSLSFRKGLDLGDKRIELATGLVFSNIGSKISYISSGEKEYLPANLGWGFSVKSIVKDKHVLSIGFDLNKLMVPTPISANILDGNGVLVVNEVYDADKDGIADFKQKSVLNSIFSSFADGEAKEEFQELGYSLGLEYLYNQMLALRMGYHHEHTLKGNRKYVALGFGVCYNIVQFNFSYCLVSICGIA